MDTNTLFEIFLSNKELWERPIFDLWAISHFLSGVLIAFILFKKTEIKFWSGFFISLAVVILWEWFEDVTGINSVEYISNRFGDIVIAQIGFFVGFFLYKKFHKKGYKFLFYILIMSLLGINLLGWLAYRSYVSSVLL